MTTTVSSAVAERDNSPQGLIQQYRSDFAMVLPTHIKPDQWVRIVQGALRRDKNLARVAQANPGSFLSALLDAARLGLEPGDTYHLVTFGNEVVGITDYTGELELIYRADEVTSVKAEIVYANDHFRYDSTMSRPEHKPDWFSDRGEMVGVFAFAEMKGGGTSRVVVMNKQQVEKVKAVSKTARSSSSPWNQWPDRMWLKTAVKQLAKWVPSSPNYREQAAIAQAAAETARGSLPPTTALPEQQEDVPAGVDPDTGEVLEAELVDDEPASAWAAARGES